MAPHSSILAWRSPWTEEPGRLQSMGLQRVGHHWATHLAHQESTRGQVKGVEPLRTPSSSSATWPLNRCHKTPHQTFPGWDTGFQAQASCVCPSLMDKAIELFFSTSPKALSLRFNSAPGHRGWVLGITALHMIGFCPLPRLPVHTHMTN